MIEKVKDRVLTVITVIGFFQSGKERMEIP